MVGTGPFKFKSWTVGDNVTIDKNPDYWNKDGIAHVEAVIFKPVADATAPLNALQTGDIDLAHEGDPDRRRDGEGRPATSRPSTGATVQPVPSGDEPDAQAVLTTRKIREAIAYAVNKQSYIDAFYGGLAVASRTTGCRRRPSSTRPRPCRRTTSRRPRTRSPRRAGGDQLTIDSLVPVQRRPAVHAGPEGHLRGDHRRTRGGRLQGRARHRAVAGGYLCKDESAGKYPMWLLGWTCDWAGADNFLKTAFFGYVDGKPSPEFAYKNDELEKTMKLPRPLSGDRRDPAKAPWEKAHRRGRPPDRAARHSGTPPGRGSGLRQGLVGSGNLIEFLNTV